MPDSKHMLFCPVNLACDILQPRWTILILAEIGWGTSRFNDLRQAIPGLSPSLLSKRLRDLETQGLLERVENTGKRGVEYLPTQAARDLEPIIASLGKWAYRHAGHNETLPDADVCTAVWNLRRCIDVDALPDRPVVMQWSFPDQAEGERDYWLYIRPGGPVDLCFKDPGFDVDLYIAIDLPVYLAVYFGYTTFAREAAEDRMQLIGDAVLARNIDRWLVLSSYAQDTQRKNEAQCTIRGHAAASTN